MRAQGIAARNLCYTFFMTRPHPAGDPFQHPFGTLSHYYGDIVRSLFIAASVLAGISVPFFPDMYSAVVVCAPVVVVLLVLAGLMSPQARLIMILSAVAGALGVIFTELTAIGAYDAGYYTLFVVLELLALTFVLALYFAVKDVRAMLTNKIGKEDTDGPVSYDVPPDEVV